MFGPFAICSAHCYGPHYRYREFYDDYWLRKTVYSDNYLFLVATDDDRVIGSASVLSRSAFKLTTSPAAFPSSNGKWLPYCAAFRASAG